MTTAMGALAEILPPEALMDGAGAAPQVAATPEAVVAPGSVDEVATLLGWATRERVCVLPVASGRRAGVPSPRGPYVVLSTRRLTGIEEYEAADLTITARAGTPVASVNAALGESGQWVPFDPPHVSERSVGGLTALGDAGPLRTGYGDLRNHVLGARVVTGDGRILALGGRVVKNVAGFDVLKAVVGSGGTLAVVTSVCLRAFPVPAVDRVLSARGTTINELLPLARAVRTAPVMPASTVIVSSLEATGGDPALVVRLHGAPAAVDADRRRLEEHAGRGFDALGDGGVDAGAAGVHVDAVLREVRDHAAAGEFRVEASARPSRLRGLLDALETLGVEEIAIEAYGGRLRACGSCPGMAALDEARRAVERLGGAIRYAAAGAQGVASAGTHPSEHEKTLAGRLVRAFDPQAILSSARGGSNGGSTKAMP